MWRGGRVLILVAHPDDETLGCGGEMIHWPDCVIVHTTDGSPLNPRDAQAAGFASRDEYHDARQRELRCALSQNGGRDTRCLGFVDGESWRELARLTRLVQAVIDDIRPDAVITHPFEGGHPDHDAAAFALQQACAALGPTESVPVRLEAAFYNRWGGTFRANQFLPGSPATEIHLDRAARQRKEAMFACFASQQGILSLFSKEVEPYRTAPHYSFCDRPHEGPLNYETFGWGVTFDMWAQEAARALVELG